MENSDNNSGNSRKKTRRPVGSTEEKSPKRKSSVNSRKNGVHRRKTSPSQLRAEGEGTDTRTYGNRRKRKNRQKRPKWLKWAPWIALLLVIATVSLTVAAYFNVIRLPDFIQAKIDIFPDYSAKDGSLGPLSDEKIEAGNYRIIVNQVPTMKEGSRDCNINVENPVDNIYNSRLSLYMADSGEYIGGTHMIAPGKRVDNITLNRTLGVGEYPVTAIFDLFDGTKSAGSMSVGITIRIVKGL